MHHDLSGQKMITSIFSYLSRSISKIAVFSLIMLFCSMNLNSLLRWLIKKPIQGAVEASEALMVFIAFCALSYTQMIGGHIKIELVTSRLPPKIRQLMETVALFLSLVLLIVMTYQNGIVALKSILILEYRWGTIPIPIWPIKLLVFISLLFWCLQLVGDLLLTTQKYLKLRSR